MTSTDSANSSKGAKQIVMNLCREAGVCGNLCSANEVRVSVLEGEKYDLAIIINANKKNTSGKICSSNCYSGCKPVYGNILASPCDGGFEFELAPNESAIVRLERG